MSSLTSRVLPTPDSPASKTTVGASRSASSSSASSDTLPTKWLLVSLAGMPEVSLDRTTPAARAGRIEDPKRWPSGCAPAELIVVCRDERGCEVRMHFGLLSLFLSPGFVLQTA